MNNLLKVGLTLCLVAFLSACGGGGGSASTSSGTLVITGTAAVGSAIANGSVSAKCKVGSGSATTSSEGTYTLSLTNGVGPCILKVTDPVTSKVFHSLLEAGETKANLTPLTDLIVSNTLAVAPSVAFSDFTDYHQSLATSTNISGSASIVNAFLIVVSANMSIAGFDPLKSTFLPSTGSRVADWMDQKIDLLNTTLATFSKSHSDLVSMLKSAKTTTNAANAMRSVAGGGSTVSYQTLGFTGGENSNGTSIVVGGVSIVIPAGTSNSNAAEAVKVGLSGSPSFANHAIERRENTLLVIFPPTVTDATALSFSAGGNTGINMSVNAPSGVINGLNYGTNPWLSFINNSSLSSFQTLGFTGYDNSNGGAVTIGGVSITIPSGLSGNAAMAQTVATALSASSQFANHIITRRDNTLLVTFPPSISNPSTVSFINTSNSRVGMTVNAPSGIINGVNHGTNPWSIFFKMI